ncbi:MULTISPECIES: SDR family NAD(P)-dependent oxidoreductase [Actinokineospora]|uniref:Short-chain dehydrogenase n=1 Tax=Actinokineospora fastidiosa TaxID=1816 RepID=A0A918LFP8_9PSEU|nr:MULTISPECIES: SDR family NAD(P)-dependent oxidoreductase [Actinokineospora]UVS77394.1 2-(R)-hydroxypropyl-CoM dehydrogenase [Actinokineospora sp. UTMC 2448]GGS43628.1 short-chain dehydrogenase [Actinokineospora fastidiosa]
MKTALVTGGTGGLGSAVTAALLDDGWRVVVPWIAEAELARLPEHDHLVAHRADLFSEDDAAACAALASGDPNAPLGAVVNLVGGFAMGGRLHETPVAEFERLLRLNLRPTYLATHAALPHLIAGGGGAVVCVSARAVERPFPGASAYITAKTAVLGLVAALAAEYGRDGVRANAILPGVIDTPGNRAAMPDSDRADWVSPERIAATVRFLCGEDASAINGARVPVAGP